MTDPRPPVLVTGSGRGIGRAVALALAADGWHLLLHFRQGRRQPERTAEDCAAYGVRVALLAADLVHPAGVASLSRQVEAHTDALAGLVNNAGIYEGHDLERTAEEEWVLAVNLRAPFFLIRSLSSALRKSSGAVVNIASILALTSAAGAYPYQAAKAGLVQVTQGPSTAPAGRTLRSTARWRPRLLWEGGGSPRTWPPPSPSCSRMPPASSPGRCWP